MPPQGYRTRPSRQAQGRIASSRTAFRTRPQGRQALANGEHGRFQEAPPPVLPLPIFLELLLDQFGQRLVHLLRFPAVGADHPPPRLTVEPQAVVVAAAVVSDEEEGLPPVRE